VVAEGGQRHRQGPALDPRPPRRGRGLAVQGRPQQVHPARACGVGQGPGAAAEDRAGYIASGAIRHQQWDEKRIDFQPYPFPSYTEELVKRLKTTLIEGDNGFLAGLDPAQTARDLVDDRFVRNAIAQSVARRCSALPTTSSVAREFAV
jgi:NitT/TauT family transport system substrate-binding protein